MSLKKFHIDKPNEFAVVNMGLFYFIFLGSKILCGFKLLTYIFIALKRAFPAV